MKYFIIFLFPLSIFSQNISGKVYDSETSVKGMDVFNLSKEIRAYTDDDGRFTIKASVGDTLSFHSLFHNQKTIKLQQADFENIMVIELSKTINRLNEILLQNNIDPKEFNTVKQEKVIEQTIEEDSKVNPHLYATSSEYGLDFIRLAGLVGKLLKKNKSKVKVDELATSKTLDSLFQKDAFFNKKLLTKDLKIPELHKQLFYEFCETNGISKTLITKENNLLLLEELMVLSEAFLKNIEIAEEN